MGRLLDLARTGSTAKPEEIAAIEQATNGTVVTSSADQQLRVITLLAEVSRPAWRTARQHAVSNGNLSIVALEADSAVRVTWVEPASLPPECSIAAACDKSRHPARLLISRDASLGRRR